MAKVSVSVDVPLAPEEAWRHASDLRRYKEWLVIHRVWRSTLPEHLDKGAEMESIVEVKGMPSAVLIDRLGIVRHVHRGFRAGDEQELATRIEQLLEEQPCGAQLC